MPSYDAPYLGAETFEAGGETVPGGVVELRVHGVNGGTAENNLQDPHPIRVSGDATAGFYRRRSALNGNQVGAKEGWPGRRVPKRLPEPQRTVEAYNWSNINSKARGRAWWVFLFPFAFLNLAGYVLPKGLSTARQTAARILLRLVALAGTLATLVGITLIAVDLVAVQCGGSAPCTDRGWLGWLDTVVGWGDLDSDATRRAVVFMSVPLLALLFLWFLGRRGARYEDYGAPRVSDDRAHGEPIDALTLGNEAFWRAPDAIYVLTWLHATAGMAAVAGTMAFALRELGGGGTPRSGLLVVGVASGLVVGAVVASLVVFGRLRQIPRGWLRKPERPLLAPRWSWIASGTGIALVVAVAWLGWITPDAVRFAPPLDSTRSAFIGFGGAAIGLVVIVALAVGAWRPIAAGGVVAVAAVAVLWTRGGEPLFGGAGGTWLAVEAGIAVVAVVGYAIGGRKGKLGSDDPMWIYLGLAAVAVVGIGAAIRGATLWGVIPISIAYLVAQFAIQVREGNDRPASEEMRTGVAAVLSGLGMTAVLTLISGLVVFTAQRLGSDVAFYFDPILDPGVISILEADTIIGTPDGLMLEGNRLFTASGETHRDETFSFQIVEFSARLEPRGGDRAISVEGDGAAFRDLLSDPRLVGATLEIDAGVARVLAGATTGGATQGGGVAGDGDLVALDDLFGEVRLLSPTRGTTEVVIADAVMEFRADSTVIDGTPRIFYAAEIAWYAVAAFAGFIVFVAGAVLRAGVLWLFRWRDKGHHVGAGYDAGTPAGGGGFGEPYDLDSPFRKKKFSRKAVRLRWLANLTDDVDWLLSSAVYTTIALFLGIVFVRLQGPGVRVDDHAIIGIAVWWIVSAWVVLYLAVRRARDDQRIRRSIGMVWDVTSFFPRRFHPLAPPCYAEKAVLDLRNRIIQVRRHAPAPAGPVDPETEGRLLIVAHSEGTLLTAAALLTLGESERKIRGEDLKGSAGEGRAMRTVYSEYTLPEGHAVPSGTELDGVFWVTYGCMLRRLFSRAWPSQLPLDELRSLKHRLELGEWPGDAPPEFPGPRDGTVPRWINFGRHSDYLGGRVFSELQARPTRYDPWPEGRAERCDDVFFGDPVRRWRQWGQFEHARSWTHSFGYQSDMEDPRFRLHVWRAGWVLTDPKLEKRVIKPEATHPDDCMVHP